MLRTPIGPTPDAAAVAECKTVCVVNSMANVGAVIADGKGRMCVHVRAVM